VTHVTQKKKPILGLGSGGFSKPVRIDPGPGDPLGQLYDMQTDFKETTNLWAQNPGVVKYLETVLDQYIREGRSRGNKYPQ
jgi:hypothetical protein